MQNGLKKAATWIAIIGGAIALSTGLKGIVAGVVRYFAKQSHVEKIEKRVDLRIADDDVRYQEQRIQRIRGKIEFQQRTEPPSGGEKAALEEAEKRLRKLEEERGRRREQYEQAR